MIAIWVCVVAYEVLMLTFTCGVIKGIKKARRDHVELEEEMRRKQLSQDPRSSYAQGVQL